MGLRNKYVIFWMLLKFQTSAKEITQKEHSPKENKMVRKFESLIKSFT